MNYKIILLIFGAINFGLIIWTTESYNLILNKIQNKETAVMPVINPLKKDFKVKPNEADLFPHSDSTIWNAFEDEKKITKKNDDNPIKIGIEATDDQVDSIDKNTNDLVTKENDSKKENSLYKEKTKEQVVAKNKNQFLEENKKAKLDKNINDLNKANDSKKELVKESIKNDAINYYVQLASVKEFRLIDKEWRRLKRIYPTLDSQEYISKEVKLKDGNTFFRILVGVFKSKEESRKFCETIFNKSNCIIRQYD